MFSKYFNILLIVSVMTTVTGFFALAEDVEKTVAVKEAAEVGIGPSPLTHEHHAGNVQLQVVAKPVTLEPDVEVFMEVSLKTKDGKTLGPDDLEETHTQKVHALIVDESLTDYVHVHPKAGKESGAWSFSFTPKTKHNYKIWFDVRPKAGMAQIAALTVEGTSLCKKPCVKEKDISKADVEGFKSTLAFDKDQLSHGGNYKGMIRITRKDGTPVTDIEPLMGSFAHIIGFDADLGSVAHMHAMGDEPTSGSDRSAEPVRFIFSPAKKNFVKLFAQVRIDGKEYIFPYGVTVR